MAKHNLSLEVKRARNREYQRKRRERINNQPDRKAEEQHRERERWRKRVVEGKIKQVGDMTEQARRLKRRIWRSSQRRSRKCKKYVHTLQIADTPPGSPLDEGLDEPGVNRQSLAGERTRRRHKKRRLREIKSLKNKLLRLKRERDSLKKKVKRAKHASKCVVNSPQTMTEKIISGSDLRNPSIKRTLLFHHALVKELSATNKNKTLPRKQTLTLSGKILKKYRILHKIQQFGISYKSVNKKQSKAKKARYIQVITKDIQDFFHNSARITTDKQDTITRNKVKRQRMILMDTMINLHKEFTTSNPTVKISYSSFCALRPFHITAPKHSDRKTCLCKFHENAALMLEVLKSSGVVDSTKLEDSFKLVCCTPATESCLLRKCTRCVNKQTLLLQEHKATNVHWRQWERVGQSTADETYTSTIMVSHEGKLSELIRLYEEKLKSETTTHVCLVRNQSQEYRNLIQTCKENEVIVHIDFSEAWKCKYHAEVQACHFGQNLPLLNLHTGMYYTKEAKSGFCTISESKRQDAASIWAYMDPVLREIHRAHPSVDTVHFWSDGPSKQYKNKKNFFLLSVIPLKLGFERATWNFFPTSHGKGAPDGIGGAVKRAADSLVLRGHDIVNAKQFHDKVSNSLNNVLLYLTDGQEIERFDKVIPTTLKPLPATRRIHQVIPDQKSLWCRELTCFCSEPRMCYCFSPVCSAYGTVQGSMDDQRYSAAPKKNVLRPLAQLQMEMEAEPPSGPEGTSTGITVENIKPGDWMAVVYDEHWWLARAVSVDGENQDVRVEFLHPHGPNEKFTPQHGRRDECFCPVKDVLVKLVGNAAPMRLSQTREIYSISPDVMDFIEGEHISLLLPSD